MIGLNANLMSFPFIIDLIPVINSYKGHKEIMTENLDQRAENMPCKYCARIIPNEATFCFYCGKELVARPERPSDNNSNKKIQLSWLPVLLVVVGVVGYVLLRLLN
jgi:hypothetical protein